MKIAIAQLNYHVGNFEFNTNKIIENIESAKVQKADLIIFAELAICGYPPRDFLEFDEFIDRCQTSLHEIAKNCIGITAIVGAPIKNPKIEGKDVLNIAAILENGKVKSLTQKALLPTYDVFDEYRYFEPATSFTCVTIAGVKIALTICEDLWNVDDNPLYTINPMDDLMKQSPELMINIAASPFNYAHRESRIETLAKNAKRYQLPLIYVNHVGAQTELIFDGGSLVFDKSGEILEELNYFSEELRFISLKQENNLVEIESNPLKETKTKRSAVHRIHDALVMGIKDYFQKSGFSKATLGLSGGIDSAVVLALATEALGKENVLPVLMPSPFSSSHSVDDSVQMVKNLGVKHEIIPISQAYDAILQTLEPQFKNQPFNLTEENIQARIRGILLMAMSNKFGYILLNTSNKSENAVGFGTLYGDMCGGLSVIGDVYKTQVYELARYINRETEIIPQNILDKAPSAELRPDQKDSDSLPEYDILDQILYHYIEERKSGKEIISLGHEADLVHRVLRLVNTSEYKRHQTPPILRVSSKAFGMGRRMPIVGKYLG